MTFQNTDRILIIPAAGAGVRFRELGKNYPKCILPVQGTPIIVTAIQELADKTGAFVKVVVAAGSSAHAQDIKDALAPFNLKTPVEVIDVQVPYWLKPSPAVSLNTVLWTQQLHRRNGVDFDATIFLSDMLPKNERVAKMVVEMPTNSWAVVEKRPDDYKRWCMVQPNGKGAVVFYDKPLNQPPTRFAAVGVYRYRSAIDMIAAFDQLTKGYDGDRVTLNRELQFSEVADIYQETNALSVVVTEDSAFVDFGTLEEYLANKGINKCRSFNQIAENKMLNTVTKTSKLHNKIKDEIVWLQNAPGRIKKYLPVIHETDVMRGSITMEKIRSSNLRDVALYLDRSYDTWVEVFKEVKEFLSTTELYGINPYGGDIESTNVEFWQKMWSKTEERLEAIDFLTSDERCDAFAWLYNDFAETIANFTKYPETYYDHEEMDCDRVVYMHGDLHFANMFYCFHYKDLKVIDPRGDVRGSVFYDLAKLCHSVYGRYDYIDAELYRITPEGKPQYYSKGHDAIESAFHDVIFSRFPTEVKVDLMRLTASLFLSMIPLHADKPEHQRLFYTEFQRLSGLANAMKNA